MYHNWTLRILEMSENTSNKGIIKGSNNDSTKIDKIIVTRTEYIGDTMTGRPTIDNDYEIINNDANENANLINEAFSNELILLDDCQKFIVNNIDILNSSIFDNITLDNSYCKDIVEERIGDETKESANREPNKGTLLNAELQIDKPNEIIVVANENHVQDKAKIIMYSDQCGGQNKNIKMYNFINYAVNSNNLKVEQIDHKFLVSGHSFLACDQDFVLIEKEKKYHKQIYVPSDWAKVAKSASKRKLFTVHEMLSEHFFSCSKLLKRVTNRKKTHDGEPVK